MKETWGSGGSNQNSRTGSSSRIIQNNDNQEKIHKERLNVIKGNKKLVKQLQKNHVKKDQQVG